MKKLFLSLAILVGVSLTTSVSAQEGKRGNKHRANLPKELNLSDEQKQKVESANADFKTKLDELKAKSELSKEDKQAKIKDLREQHRAAISNVLTPEQQAKTKELRDKRGSKDIDKKKHRGDRKDVFHGKKGKKDRGQLDEASKSKLTALREKFEKEKKAIEMSRIAPDMQKQKLSELRKNFRKEKQQIIKDSHKNKTTT